MPRIADNLKRIRDSIAAAAERSGRAANAVTLVAVTKSASAAEARELALAGCADLGEGRPQELWYKQAALPDLPIRWHLVGHLQRNKVERTLPLVSLIHSVDSLRLLEALERACPSCRPAGSRLDVYLEVNASREVNKHGFAPQEIVALAPALLPLTQLRVVGLMTMAAYEEDPERCRPTFATVRRLRDRLRQTVGPAHPLQHLSMGMSNDFEVAIEEGATVVRLGTVLFEGLQEGPEP